MLRELTAVIILASCFEFINGMRNSSNIVATMISSRAFRPQTALAITAMAWNMGDLVLWHPRQFVPRLDRRVG